MHLDIFVPKWLVRRSSTRSSHIRKLSSYVCIRGERITPGDPGVVEEMMGKERSRVSA